MILKKVFSFYRLGISVVSMLFALYGHSQQCNFITNGGFENINFCPTSSYTGNGTPAGAWVGAGTDPGGVVMPWIQITYGSVDSHNTCNVGNTTVPPNSGNGYLGFLPFSSMPSPGWAEYFKQELTDSLVAGQTYCLSFYANVHAFSTPVASNIEVIIDEFQVVTTGPSFFGILATPYAVDYTFSFPNFPTTGYAGWTKACYNFTATGGEKWIAFGQFAPATGINTASNGAYVFMDDIGLFPVTPYSVNTTEACNGCDGSATTNVPGSYSWYTLNDSLIASGVDSISNLCIGDYYVLDDCSCKCDTIFFSINPGNCILSVDLPNYTICSGDSVFLNANVSGGVQPYTYSWTGISDTTSGIMVSPLISTNYIITVSDNTGAQASDTAFITVIPSIFIDLGFDTTLCNGPLLLDAGNSGYDILWSTGDTTQMITVNTNGSYIVNIQNGICQNSDTINVSFIGPSIDLGPDIVTCQPDTLIDAMGIDLQYLWQDGSTMSTYFVSDTGTYFVEVTDTNGCTASDTLLVLAYDIFVELGDTLNFCFGDTIVLTAPNGNFNYVWQNGDTGQSIEIFEGGLYWVEVSEGVCINRDSVEVIFENPSFILNATDSMICESTTVWFTTSSLPTSISWQWNFGDGNGSTLQNPTHTYYASGAYSITMSAITENGCVMDTTFQIDLTVIEKPISLFSYVPDNPELGETVFFSNLSQNSNNWLWIFGDGDSSYAQNPNHVFSEINSFEVTLIAYNSYCSDSLSTIFSIDDELFFYVPNAFTPDGNNYNNIFIPVFSSDIDPSTYKFIIFNRWGELIFESNDPSIGWDGSYKGAMSSDGVYIWKVEFEELYTSKKYASIGHVVTLK